MSATVEFQWTPHEKQRRVLESDTRFRVLNWGRRTGKNEVAIVDTIRYALENPDSIVWWVSPTYEQSNDYGFDRMLEMLPNALVQGEPTYSKPRSIELITGTTISFKSADKPKSLKGGGVDRMVVDEAASIAGDIWYEYLRPTLTDTLGGGCIISTPKGKDWFHTMFYRGQEDEDDTVWSSHATSFDNPHVPDSEIEQQRENMPDRIYEQEYLAEFTEDAGEVFIDMNIEDYDYESKVGSEPYRIGVDYARHHDWTVVLVLDSAGYVVHIRRVQKTSWHAIEAVIKNVYEQFQPATVQVDATRDNKITEDLEAVGVNVEPIKFTQQKKADMVENCAAMLEAGDVTIPEDASRLRREMEAFEYDVTRAGNVRYAAGDTEHDDMVDALCLAADAPEPMSATW